MSPQRMMMLLSTFLILFHGDLKSSRGSPDIHDVLPEYGFPKGLLPNNVISYTLSSDASFILHLDAPCYVYWEDQLVYYNTLIKGTLTYGSVSHVSGIQAQKLFLWLPVTGIKLHQDSGTLQFFVGAFSQEFPATDFQDVPGCARTGSLLNPNLFLPL
ncbi:uncharacterized protein LOC106767784 [Vigna radiata var. radiata]|uniref:Uncharacterized protein LOC106767784 n=1 Tax=Vigna radiata var. radiata TaxID=3916 RepID=A0A1S3UQG2_VIGRR|nr:uncharacterized protein LOC106767784 [Vigna radiata var. radiata]